MIKSLNHIGIAVWDLEKSIKLFKKIFEFDDFYEEIVAEQSVKVASFNIGDVKIELTSPLNEESPIFKFIKKRGEGIHHLAFESDDVKSDLQRMKENDINLINDDPKLGAHKMLIAFLHPKSTNGVLMEMCQTKID